jgi:hypothetical protein
VRRRKTRLTEEEEKMEIAVRAFVTAERKFRKLDEHPWKVSDPKINLAWWNCLEDMYVCDKALWDNSGLGYSPECPSGRMRDRNSATS